MRPHVAELRAALASLLLAACSDQAPRVSLPADANLLFVSLDTTRADRLGCYGHARAVTPVIDRLAAEGQRFDAAYTPMPTTLPAHASMFTSLEPAVLGVLRNRHILPQQALTLAERLRAAGFATGAFVGGVPLEAQFGLDQGFDVYRDSNERGGRRAEAVRLEAAEWIAAQGTKRFFCFVHFYDAHSPYDPPAAQRERLGVPDGVFASSPREDCGFASDPGALAPEILDAAERAYEGEIAYVDEQIGALLDQLAEAGVRERTLVVITSDHGETLGELASSKGYVFDHGEFLYRRELRIPLVLWLPPGDESTAPAIHPEPVSVLDFLPTLLELFDLPCAAPFSGRSLVPLFAGGSIESLPLAALRHQASATQPVAYQGERFSLVDGRWHLIESQRGIELYDCEADPGEERELAATQPERVERMRRALAAWRETKSVPLWGASELSQDAEAAAALELLGY